jgi:hypothetical protein
MTLCLVSDDIFKKPAADTAAHSISHGVVFSLGLWFLFGFAITFQFPSVPYCVCTNVRTDERI